MHPRESKSTWSLPGSAAISSREAATASLRGSGEMVEQRIRMPIWASERGKASIILLVLGDK